VSAGLPEGVLREHAEGCTLAVRVQPGAKRTAIVGIYGEGEQAALKIAVQAPAIDGRANEALIAFVAEVFGVQRSSVAIAYGQSGRSKSLILNGLPVPAARRKLQSLL
jgi:uncharacterized protein (TIGR00251 family)